MYENEDVDENEAKNLAVEHKAIFQKTSAKSANGVEDLFIKIGKRFLNPKGDEAAGAGGNKNDIKGDKKKKIKLNKKNSDRKHKKGFC